LTPDIEIDCKCLNQGYIGSPEYYYGGKSGKSGTAAALNGGKSGKSGSAAALNGGKSGKSGSTYSPGGKSSKTPTGKSSKTPTPKSGKGGTPAYAPITCLVPPTPIDVTMKPSKEPTPAPVTPTPAPVRPTPAPVNPTPAPVVPAGPNCDDDVAWISTEGATCAYYTDFGFGNADNFCAIAVDDSGVSASEACPTVCVEECKVNCDDDILWMTADGFTCADSTDYGFEFCSIAVGTTGEPAMNACPTVCNPECQVNCDNDEGWFISGGGCDIVAEDPTLCDTVFSNRGVSASDACPLFCNPECREPITTPIPTPKPSPLDTVVINTPLPTLVSTIKTSDGGTITVSTETTGPPTLANRDDEETR